MILNFNGTKMKNWLYKLNLSHLILIFLLKLSKIEIISLHDNYYFCQKKKLNFFGKLYGDK